MTNPLGCLMTGVPAGPLPGHVEQALRDGLAGIIVFSRNVEDAPQLTALTRRVRELSPRALIAVDEEGGGASHLAPAGVPAQPGHLALGALGDPDLTRRVAYDIASALAGLGINADFAPCADVNTNPDNPVIGARSFGSDPDTAARHVRAFVAGMQARGVAACVKHFPGHGDTAADSHLALPAGTPELTPFTGTGAAMMMSAHVTYPGLADEPATLSRRVLTDLARGELGYDGVIVTDALEMRAIADRSGYAEASARALTAGADLILIGLPPGRDELTAVTGALAACPASRLAEAARRVAALAETYAGPSPEPAPDGHAGRAVAAALAARQSGAGQGPPVLKPGAFVVDLRFPNPGYRTESPGLADLLRLRDRTAAGRAFDRPPENLDGLLAEIPAASQLLITARDPHRVPWIAAALDRLRAARPDAIVISTGLPGEGTLNAYGPSPVMLSALLDLMLETE